MYKKDRRGGGRGWWQNIQVGFPHKRREHEFLFFTSSIKYFFPGEREREREMGKKERNDTTHTKALQISEIFGVFFCFVPLCSLLVFFFIGGVAWRGSG